MHGVGVAEQVVQVAEDLLVGADQEARRCSTARRSGGCSSSDVLHVAQVDELVDLAVAVAGEVGEDAAPRRLLGSGGGSASIGKSCFTAQWSGTDWKTEKLP